MLKLEGFDLYYSMCLEPNSNNELWRNVVEFEVGGCSSTTNLFLFVSMIIWMRFWTTYSSPNPCMHINLFFPIPSDVNGRTSVSSWAWVHEPLWNQIQVINTLLHVDFGCGSPRLTCMHLFFLFLESGELHRAQTVESEVDSTSPRPKRVIGEFLVIFRTKLWKIWLWNR